VLGRLELIPHNFVLNAGLGQGLGLQDEEECHQSDQDGNYDGKGKDHPLYSFDLIINKHLSPYHTTYRPIIPPIALSYHLLSFIYIEHHVRLNVTTSLPFASLNITVFADESYTYLTAELRESR